MRKKWLGELITKEEVLKEKNTLLISPCGSGKTYFIFNQLIEENEKVLYLCDNTNLKKSILDDNKETTTENHEEILNELLMYKNIEVSTYKKMGSRLRKRNIEEFLKDYDYIIADEIHNLIDYETFNGDADLGRAIQLLFNKQMIPILMLTATPYNLDQSNNNYNKFLKGINIIDFADSKEINRYIDIRRAYISHISQIQYELRCYKQLVEYRDGKILIFCPSIKQIKIIEDMAIKEGLSPISIWSEHNKDYELSEEQKNVRNNLFEEGQLINGYDVLIINRAMETGVNIYDKRFRLFISCSSNITQTYQARSRLRMDLDVVILKSKGRDIPNNFYLKLDDKWLNKPLFKNDIEELLSELNLKDGWNQSLGVNKLCDILVNNEYEVKQTTRRLNGKRSRCRIINKVVD